MKRDILFRLLILVAAAATLLWVGAAFSGVLAVPQRFQIYNQWCWAGVSEAILNYYGKYPTQQQIGNYGTEGVNTWNWLWGETSNPTRRGVNLILQNWGVSSTYGGYAMSFSQVQNRINAGQPFVIRWWWTDTADSGHVVAGRGYEGNNIYYMDPWDGDQIATYVWVVAGGGHQWTHSLECTSAAPQPTPTPFVPLPPEHWCLPAGGTKIGGLDFETYILIANPGNQNAPIEVHFLGPAGQIASIDRTVGPRSRMTVKMNDYVGNDKEAVSTIVTSLNGVPIICERAMYWSPGGAHWGGGHNTVGIRQAEKQWYLAEGATHIFDQFIHVLNPDEGQTANVQVVFSDQNGVLKTLTKQLPPRTNWTVDVKGEVGSRTQVATYVSSDVSIAVDRTMYWDGGGVKWIDGHASVGTPAAAETWYLAEGATHIFDEYVMVYNPSATATARVRLSFMDATGNVIPHEEYIGPRTRYTANVKVLAGIQPQVATVVESRMNAENVRVPVVAERAMYWNAGGIKWGGGHGTVGAPEAAYVWHLPEGATHIFDEYVLVYNPFVDKDANVTLKFMDGSGNVTEHRVVIGPHSRFTVKVNDVVGPLNQVSTMVQADVPVVAERAMYWDSGGVKWASGHDTVGVPAD